MSNQKKNQPTTPTPRQDWQKLFADTNVSMKTGRLVKDSELISEGKFVKFRIASNKEYLNKEGNVQSTTNYFNTLVSKNLTDAFNEAKGLKKGDWVYVKGEDRTQSFDTPEGYKQTANTIFAYKVHLRKEKDIQAVPKTEKTVSSTNNPTPS